MTSARTVSHGWMRFAPALFVVIWASGYLVAKAVALHADPLTFLTVRYSGVAVLMTALALLVRAPWPRSGRELTHLAVAGVSMQAIHLGAVWIAVKHGMPAGLAALIVNVQPLLTAAAGLFLGERVRPVQWLGLALGLLGVTLVVWNKLGGGQIGVATVMLAVVGLLAMTTGTLYQKRFIPNIDLLTGQVVQFGASVAVTLPFALMFETLRIEWNPQLVAAMLWSIFVLTGGGVSLLYMMLRAGTATRVTSYMYLVPAVTAVMAWLMFGERLTPVAIAGMGVTILGVALVVRRSAAPIEAGAPAARTS